MSIKRTPRGYLDGLCMVRSRYERRRLARCDAGPGRRFASRVSLLALTGASTRDALHVEALLAAPGARRRDVEVSSPAPGSILIELRGRAATQEAALRVYNAVGPRCPVGVVLDVRVLDPRNDP